MSKADELVDAIGEWIDGHGTDDHDKAVAYRLLLELYELTEEDECLKRT
jgi:hypothetical protein